MFKTDVQKLRNALEFTRVYKENANDIYLREAACMDFQLRHILVPMDENDGIAGRYEHDFVGFSSQVGGIYTYYFNEHEFLNAYMACKQNGEITVAEDYALQAVQAYWHEENTARKVELEFSKRYGYVPPKAFPGAGVGNCDCRVAGTNLDFEKLIRLGFDGLDQEIDRAAEVNGASSFYTALKLWIESLRGACERYREQALELTEKAETEEAKTRFTKLAEALLNIQHSTPKTFLEGVQLMWIYAVSSDIMNYSRMDDYLGPLYAADIDAGRITEEEAVQTVLYLYKHFKEINKIHDCRVIIGGVGRILPDRDRQNEAQSRINEAEVSGAPSSRLRLWRSFLGWILTLLFAWEVAGRLIVIPLLFPDWGRSLPPSALDQIMALLLGMLGLGC